MTQPSTIVPLLDYKKVFLDSCVNIAILHTTVEASFANEGNLTENSYEFRPKKFTSISFLVRSFL